MQQTNFYTVRLAIVNSFTSSVFPSEVNGETEKNFLSCGRFHSLLVAFRNSKTRRHSEIKQTRPSTKQDFSGEATPRPHQPHYHATRPGRRPSGPPYLHSVYTCLKTVPSYRWVMESGGMFICSKLGQNLSQMEVRTFVRIQRVNWDHLLAFKAEIIRKQALFQFPC